MSIVRFAIVAVTAAAVSLAACETAPVTKEEMAGLNYGPRPEHWRDTIRSYLNLRLTDPNAAILEFRTEPRVMYQRRTEVRDLQYGWASCVWVNDKNKEGRYDGFYPMTFFLRDE